MSEIAIIIIIIIVFCVILYFNDICINNIVVLVCVSLTLLLVLKFGGRILGGAKDKNEVTERDVGGYIVEHLRHHTNFGNKMNSEGWVLVDDIQDDINMKYHWTNDNAKFKVINWKAKMDKLDNGDKNKRLEFKEDEDNGDVYIRALQGHTNLKIPLKVRELDMDIQHVTTEEAWEKIKESGGMKKISRFYMMFNKAGGPAGRPNRDKYPITIIVSKDKINADGTIEFGYTVESDTWQTEGKFISEEKDGNINEYYLLPISMFSRVYRHDNPDINLLEI